jgi:phosphoadenosine phosphosulfate reductase
MNDQSIAPHLPNQTAPDRGALTAIGERLAGAFGGLGLEERLTAARAAVPGRLVFTTSFGLEDQAISHAIFTQDLAIEVVTFDTGRLFPETHQVWAETEQHYGRRILALLPERRSVEAWVAQHGINGFRSSVEARQGCCGLRRSGAPSRAHPHG